MTAPTEARVAAMLTRALGQDVCVMGLERLAGGSSREIWSFAASWDGSTRELVLRRDPPGEVRVQGAEAESRVMEAARAAGVTVPAVIALAGIYDSDLPGGGLVMERVVGESIPRRILSSPQLEGARASLAHRCGLELGRLHSIDVATLPGLPQEDRLAHYRAELDRLSDVRPVLELAYAWLGQHKPPAREPVLVHGDFRLGNFVVDPTGLVAVLDWESAHVGDRMEDLGWIAVNAWRFRGPEPIGGFGGVGEFLDAYQEACGVDVATAEFEWAVVLGTWVWAVGCLVQANRHLSGATRSVDLAVVGRRVVEVELDLLELIA